MKIDWSKFKKKHSDDQFTTMVHEDGHELRIRQGSLSKDLKKQLDKLPQGEDQDGQVMMKSGGEVKDNVKDVDPEKAKKFVESFNKPLSFKDAISNLKEGLSGKKKPEGYADGGEVADRGPKMDKKKAAEFSKGASESGYNPDSWKKNLKSAFGMANGGMMPSSGLNLQLNQDEQDPLSLNVNNPSIPDDIEQRRASMMSQSQNPNEQPFSSIAIPGVTDTLPQESGMKEAFSEAPKPSEEVAPSPEMKSTPTESIEQAPQMQQEPSLDQQAKQLAQAPQNANQLVDSIKQTEKAQIQLAKKQEVILGAQAKAAQDLMDRYESHAKELESERSALQQDILDKHIDPQRYMGSMDSYGKLMTSTALILGGLAGGGNGNQALEMLNKQIDRDIEAQKSELGKKETLLSANLKQFGNMNDAVQMTKLMQSDMVAAKLKQAEAQANQPLAKARASQLLGQIQAFQQQTQTQLATKQLLSNLEQEAQQDPSKLPQYLSLLEKTDPKKAEDVRKRAVAGAGIAPTGEEATKLREVKSASSNTIKGINDLLALSNKAGSSISPTDRTKAQTISSLLVGALNKQVTGGGPMSEKEQELVRSIVANPTAIFSLDENNKTALKTLMKRTHDWVASEFESRGIQDPRMSSLNSQQKSFLQWAQQNPENPKAKLILQKLGFEE